MSQNQIVYPFFTVENKEIKIYLLLDYTIIQLKNCRYKFIVNSSYSVNASIALNFRNKQKEYKSQAFLDVQFYDHVKHVRI